MEVILGIFIGISGVGIAAAVYFFWWKKPEEPEQKTVNMGVFTPEEDCTTVIPVPIHASTCDHKWDIIADHILDAEHEKKAVTILSCQHCGLIDKTVQVTSPPPPAQPEPLEPCKHDWQVQIEQALEVAHEQKVVIVLTCRNCGQIDKTVETTSRPSYTRSECHHVWETEKKVELLSAYEQMLKSISVQHSYNSKAKVDPSAKLDLELNDAPAWMFRKTYVSLRICEKCGEIDKTISSNFDLSEDQAPEGVMPDVPEVPDEEDEPDERDLRRRKKV